MNTIQQNGDEPSRVARFCIDTFSTEHHGRVSLPIERDKEFPKMASNHKKNNGGRKTDAQASKSAPRHHSAANNNHNRGAKGPQSDSNASVIPGRSTMSAVER